MNKVGICYFSSVVFLIFSRQYFFTSLQNIFIFLHRGGSRTAATFKMERFVIVNYYHKALPLGCCSSPRSASAYLVKRNIYLSGLYINLFSATPNIIWKFFHATGLFPYLLKTSENIFSGGIENDQWQETASAVLWYTSYLIYGSVDTCYEKITNCPENSCKFW